MRAALLTRPKTPFVITDLPVPSPAGRQILIKVHACGLCRTDLHIIDGELTKPKLPLVCGHQIVGTVAGGGPLASRFKPGERIGVPWLGATCGECFYCRSDRENLCTNPTFTGYTIDGGLAEYAVADERFCFPVPDLFGDRSAAPLLCAGLIGYRSLRIAGEARVLGLYGFGAAAHIIAQVAVFQGRTVYAFTREGDAEGQEFARSLGAAWAGSSLANPPQPLDAAIIFAPVGALVPAALKACAPGGKVVCAGIYMSDIPSFPYDLLWEERSICSVANLTRGDGDEFIRIAARIPVKTSFTAYSLSDINTAVSDFRSGVLMGSAVIDLTR